MTHGLVSGCILWLDALIEWRSGVGVTHGRGTSCTCCRLGSCIAHLGMRLAAPCDVGWEAIRPGAPRPRRAAVHLPPLGGRLIQTFLYRRSSAADNQYSKPLDAVPIVDLDLVGSVLVLEFKIIKESA